MAIRSVSRLLARPLHSRSIPALAVLATVCVVAVASPALAAPNAPSTPKTPKPSVATIERQLGELALKNSQMVEIYHQAQLKAAQAAKSAKTAQAAANATAGRYAIARQRYVQVIQDQYQTSNFGAASALLESTSNANYLDRLSALTMVSDHNSGVLTAMTQLRTQAANAARTAKASADKAAAAKTAISTEHTRAQAQIATYKKTLGELSSQEQYAWLRAQAPAVSKTTLSKLNFKDPKINPRAYQAVKFAIQQVDKPYVFGAAGPSSYDCSGLTMAAWAHAGVALPHSAAGQYGYGTHVAESNLQPGDLLFFYTPIDHVTIYAGDGLMISAPTEGENVTVVPVAAYQSDYVGATRL